MVIQQEDTIASISFVVGFLLCGTGRVELTCMTMVYNIVSLLIQVVFLQNLDKYFFDSLKCFLHVECSL